MVATINSLIPKHKHYYEPFCGSAAVLLNHPRSRLEVINDLDPEINNFFRVMADREKGAELTERLCKLWYDRFTFDAAIQHRKKNFAGLTDVEKATETYILITQSFNALRKSFSKQAFRDTAAYRENIRVNIPDVYERMAGVRVMNMDGIDLIAKVKDHKQAFIFADPPYRKELRGVGADKSYTCELPHKDQIRLLKTIRDAEAKIMLCGYRAEKGADLYDTYLKPNGWKSYKLADAPKSCQFKRLKDIGQEFVWINYPDELPPMAKYAISLKEY